MRHMTASEEEERKGTATRNLQNLEIGLGTRTNKPSVLVFQLVATAGIEDQLSSEGW